ncbi:hypothetical protein BD770DRAFT_378403 [Pilaira anomala]|nr:hypothetical protein BD770DRAFT_378403 [Pilaira anomala]
MTIQKRKQARFMLLRINSSNHISIWQLIKIHTINSNFFKKNYSAPKLLLFLYKESSSDYLALFYMFT